MANNLDASIKEEWGRMMQTKLEKDLVAMAICNTELRTYLKAGDKVHKPYRSDMKVQDYTRGTAVTVESITTTDEALTINKAKTVPFYIDDLDELQNSYSLRMEYANDAQQDLNQTIDRDILSEYDQTSLDVDDGDVGGTAGNSAVITESNVIRLFSAASKKLNNNNVAGDGRFAVVSPTIVEYLQLHTAGKDTQFGDQVLQNGFVGRRFGFDIYLSNNLTSTARWTPADDPSNGATITIAGVTFTFVSSIGSTAGNILISGTVAGTLDNLVAAINDPGTTSATQVALSAADQATLKGIVATDGTTYLGIEFVGGGEVAYTTSVAADAWSLETVHCLFGRKNAIDLVVQKQPTLEIKDVPDKLGKNFIPWTLYGYKTFAKGAQELVDVNVDSSDF